MRRVALQEWTGETERRDEAEKPERMCGEKTELLNVDPV